MCHCLTSNFRQYTVNHGYNKHCTYNEFTLTVKSILFLQVLILSAITKNIYDESNLALNSL